MKVEAYYNLHKQCLSARAIGGHVKHYEFIAARNVKFAVQPAGRQRVLRERKKNVHAFVRGEMLTVGEPYQRRHDHDGVNIDLSVDRFREDDRYDEVTYNPYKYESFVRKHSGEPIYDASHVWIIGKHIFVPAL